MASSIFNGSAVKILKDILRFKAGVEVISNDSDDPTVVAKTAPAGSLYIRNSSPFDVYRKQDSGSSTNWIRVASAAELASYVAGPVSATDNALARYDLTTGKLIQDSGVLLDDTDNITGVNDLTTTGDLDIGGTAIFGSTVTLNADGVGPLEAVTKQQLDAASGGVDVKESVQLATTADITLSGEQTIDGTLTSSSRVLVKNQAAQEENGIYTTAAGAWTRTADANTGTELTAALVTVQAGTANANTGWYQTTDNPSIGVDPVVWQQFFGAGTYTADGQGIELSGSTFSLELDGTTLSKSVSGLKVNQIANAQIAAAAAIDVSKLAALTANRAVASDGSGFLTASSTTATELGHVSGVTSAIQTQLNSKIGITYTAEGQLIISDSLLAPVALNIGAANSVLTSNGTTAVYALVANANIDPAAAIVYSKLSLTNSIVDADIAAAAAIAYSKLSLTNSIVNADIAAAAAIAYSKLSLSNSIVNADISATAAIAYSKLNLSASIVDADVATAAAIARSKLASGTANRVIVNDGTGVLSDLAAITANRALASNASGLPVATAVTDTELGYVSGVTSAIQTQLNAKIEARNVVDSRQTALSVSAATSFSPAAVRDGVQFVVGNGGAVTVTAATPVDTTGITVGQVVTIFGTSDTNTVTYQNGNNLRLNGNCTLGKDDALTIMYVGTDGTNAAWAEVARNV